MKCPNCGKQGAVAISCSPKGIVQVYCNLCEEETGLPLWWAIGKGYDGTIVKKEKPTMKVSYNGFTGELVKLERSPVVDVTINGQHGDQKYSRNYDISILCAEKQATISFTGVKLEDIKFFGGTVTLN